MKWIKRRFLILTVVSLILSVFLFAILVRIDSRKARIREMQFDHLIYPLAQRHGVDPLLVRALIWRESKFNPHSLGSAGERGLMQIMESVAQDWTKNQKIQAFQPDDLFDPETNIRVGVWHLGRSMKRWQNYENPWPFVLAEYNAGRGTVLKWIAGRESISPEEFIASIEYPSTRRYISVILKKYSQYQDRIFIPVWSEPVFRSLPVSWKILVEQ